MARGNGVRAMGSTSAIWTIHDVAAFFGMSVDSVRRKYDPRYKVRPGARDLRKIERFMIGGVWRWLRADVIAFATARGAAR